MDSAGTRKARQENLEEENPLDKKKKQRSACVAAVLKKERNVQ
jgi:hypothetical protein